MTDVNANNDYDPDDDIDDSGVAADDKFGSGFEYIDGVFCVNCEDSSGVHNYDDDSRVS